MFNVVKYLLLNIAKFTPNERSGATLVYEIYGRVKVICYEYRSVKGHTFNRQWSFNALINLSVKHKTKVALLTSWLVHFTS